VPVYRRHRLVHVHIPKTAGTAVEELFAEIDDMVWGLHSWIGEVHRNGRWFEFQHLTASEFALLTGDEFDGFSRFAIVRDPYQRLISDHLWRQDIKRANPDAFLNAYETFDQFIDAIPRGIDEGWDELIPFANRAEANLLIHVRPQHHYIRGADGQADRSIEIVRYEELPDALDNLFVRWNIDNDRVGATRTHRVQDFFSPDTLQIVNELYHRDFALLGYPMLDRLVP